MCLNVHTCLWLEPVFVASFVLYANVEAYSTENDYLKLVSDGFRHSSGVASCPSLRVENMLPCSAYSGHIDQSVYNWYSVLIC
ncbi:hypothetical protein B0T13DRAFT_74839 [Neurospora crassa]|nr:hypothetical protein B0T13DRAFT_74839 [Neurospora crassa]